MVEFSSKFIPMDTIIYKRALVEKIQQWLERPEIIVITGPRQVGKTFFCRQILPQIINKEIIYFNFEDLELRELFQNNPKEFIANINELDKIYIFDEFQKVPKLTSFLKLAYDQDKSNLPKIFLTGSSAGNIQAEIAESLVGQVVSFNLFSLSFSEKNFIQPEKYLGDLFFENLEDLNIEKLKKKTFFQQKELQNKLDEYVLYGGYPELGELDREQQWEKLKSIIQTILERDLQSLIKSEHLFSAKKLLEILAFRIGHTISFENLASELQLNIKTLRNLVSVLEGLYFIEFVYPKSSFGNEYKKAPKVYFHDLGLRSELIKMRLLPQEKSQWGSLIENFVFNQLRRYSAYKQDFKLNYWQDYNKNEVDFILNQNNYLISIEVKFQRFSKAKVSRGVVNFIKKYQPKFHLTLTRDFFGEMTIDNTKVYFLPVYLFGLIV